MANARLHLMPRPWPEPACFQHLAEKGIQRLVSLLQPAEARSLGLADEARLCQSAGLEFVQFPIPDHHVPDDMAAFSHMVKHCHQALKAGTNLGIHCFAGIGRTGLLAAAILLREGLGVDMALIKLARARGLKMPETLSQIQWLHRYQETFHP